MVFRLPRSNRKTSHARLLRRKVKGRAKHRRSLEGFERLETRWLLAAVGSGNPAPVLDTLQFPHSAVVQLELYKDLNHNGEFDDADSFSTCSGAIVGDFHVLTAAHCLYSTRFGPDGKRSSHPGWTDRIFVHAARDSEKNRPFGEARAVEMVVPECWLDSSPCFQDDLGLITLDRNLGKFTGKFKVDSLKSNVVEKAVEYFPYIGQLISAVTNTSPAVVPNRPEVSILQYPGEQGFAGVEQYLATGKMKSISLDGSVMSGSLRDLWVTGGSSGSPVLKGSFDGTQDTIIGIEARADRAPPGSDGNFDVTRLNDAAVEFVDNFLGEYPAPTDRPSLVNYDHWFFDRHEVNLVPRHTGESLTVEHRVYNAGTATANNVSVTFELHHLNSAIVRPLATVRIPTIAPFAAALATAEVVIPHNLPSGKYAIVSVIDRDDEINEFGTPYNDRWLMGRVSGASDYYSENIKLINDPPVFAPRAKTTFQIYQGDTLTHDFNATDPEGWLLQWKFHLASSQTTSSLDYQMDATTGVLQWKTSALTVPSKYQGTVTVSDGMRSEALPVTIEVLSARPMIGSLETNKTLLPNDGSELVTLSAVDAKSARKGTPLSRVEFYLDRNENGRLDVDSNGDVDASKDSFLGFDTTGFDGSTWTGPIANAVGSHVKVFARAVQFTSAGTFRSNLVETTLQFFTPPMKPPVAIPSGDQFGVKTLGYPSVFKQDGQGNYYAFSWESDGIYLQRVTNAGDVIEDSFKLIGARLGSEIAVRANGEILAVWSESNSLLAMRYSSDGVRLNSQPLNLGEFAVNDLRIAVDEMGDFLVTGARGFGPYQILGRRFAWDGTPLTDVMVLVEKTNLATFYFAELSMAADGHFVLLSEDWNFNEPAEKQWSTRGQIFSPTGQKVGSEFVVSQANFRHMRHRRGAISMNSSKQVVVLFEDPTSNNLMASRFSAQGELLGVPVQVNTSQASRLQGTIALSDSGWFTATWAMQARDPGDASFDGGVYMQVFDPQNEPRGDETRIPTEFAHDQVDPSVVMDADGDIAILWVDTQEPFKFQSSSVWARTFAINLPPTFAGVAEQTVAVGQVWQLQTAASDPDRPHQVLTYTLAADSPSGMTIDSKTGLIRWMPTNEQHGDHLLTVTVSDNGTPALSESLAVAVKVVRPDIRITGFSGGGGDQIALIYEIDHSAVAPFTVSFYRSTDRQYSDGDLPLGAVAILGSDDLAVGVHTRTFAIGAGDAQVPLPGAGAPNVSEDYQILAVVDAGNSIEEQDTDSIDEDNTAVFSGAYHLPGGPVFVHGTGDSDSLQLRRGSVVVALNEQEWTYAEDDVTSVQAWLGDSADVLHGGDLTVSIKAWGGPGDDILSGGANDDELSGGPGLDTVIGSPGNDTSVSEGEDFSAPVLDAIGTTSDPTPSITWSVVTGAVAYEVLLQTHDGIAITESAVSTISFTPPTPLVGGAYRVQVRAVAEDYDTSLWSAPMAFTIDEPAAAVPLLVEPIGVQEQSRPRFAWNPVAGAAQYELHIRSAGQETVDLMRLLSGATNYVLDIDLPEGAYTTTLRSVNSEGDKSAESAGLAFSVEVPAPSKPVPVSPTGSLTDTQPLLSWIGSDSAATYEVQIDRIGPTDPATGLIEGSGIPAVEGSFGQFFVPEPLPEGVYSFRLRGVNAFGETGGWSEPLAFTIDLENIPPESPVVLSVPAANASQELTFSWSGPPQTTSYEIRLQRLTGDGTETVFQRDQIRAIEVSIPHQFSAGQYQVHVRAFNSLGASLWSQAVEFRLDGGASNRQPTSINVSGGTLKERLAGIVVGTLVADDPDVGQSHVFTTMDDRFEIVGNTLRLKDGQFVEASGGATVNVTVTVTDSGVPPRSLSSEVVLQVIANPTPWKNATAPFDTNGDGRVVPLDVLTLINLLNNNTNNLLGTGGRLPVSRPGTSSLAYYDPNGDGFCTPNDVLQIVNFLNRSSGEAEAASFAAESQFLNAPERRWASSSVQTYLPSRPRNATVLPGWVSIDKQCEFTPAPWLYADIEDSEWEALLRALAADLVENFSPTSDDSGIQ